MYSFCRNITFCIMNGLQEHKISIMEASITQSCSGKTLNNAENGTQGTHAR